MFNEKIIINNVKRKIFKEFDLFELFWKTSPKTFNSWKDILKSAGLYRKISYYLAVEISRSEKTFNEVYLKISKLCSYDLFHGMKREQAAASFLINKEWTDVIRSRNISEIYDHQFAIDLLAVNKEKEECAFQVKGYNALAFSKEEKFILFSTMSKITKERPVKHFYLIVVPDFHQLKKDKKAKINLLKLDFKEEKEEVDIDLEKVFF